MQQMLSHANAKDALQNIRHNINECCLVSVGGLYSYTQSKNLKISMQRKMMLLKSSQRKDFILNSLYKII